MLHGGELVGKRFPQPKTAMPDPPDPPHHDIALRDTSDRTPTAREGTLQGLATTRGHDSRRELERAVHAPVKDARAIWPAANTSHATTHTHGGRWLIADTLSTDPHVTQCATHGEIDDASDIGRPSDILADSEVMSRYVTWPGHAA